MPHYSTNDSYFNRRDKKALSSTHQSTEERIHPETSVNMNHVWWPNSQTKIFEKTDRTDTGL